MEAGLRCGIHAFSEQLRDPPRNLAIVKGAGKVTFLDRTVRDATGQLARVEPVGEGGRFKGAVEVIKLAVEEDGRVVSLAVLAGQHDDLAPDDLLERFGKDNAAAIKGAAGFAEQIQFRIPTPMGVNRPARSRSAPRQGCRPAATSTRSGTG